MDVKSAANIVKDRISCRNYLQKAKRGGLICPYCGSGEKVNQSGGLSVSDDGKTFYCHVCEKTGDVIDLYMQEQNKGFRDAVTDLAASIGLYVDPPKTERRETRPLKRSQSDFKGLRDKLPSESTKTEIGGNMSAKKANTKDRFRNYCERCQADVAESDFFHRRGLSDDTIKHNLLGYDKAHGLAVFPYNKDYTYIQTRDTGAKRYRKPKETEAGGAEPVYKAEALYRSKPCFVCEGALDALAIYEAGGNACAVGGGGTDKLISQLMERWPTSPIILCFDSGEQGQKDTAKAGERLNEIEIPYTVAIFNPANYGLEGQADIDPNDLLLANRAQFETDIKANEEKALPVSDIAQFMAEIFTEKYKPIPTGLEGLDKLLHGGLLRQTLIVLMAQAGTGKTVLASQILENLAAGGFPVLYFNLEMSKEQMIARSLSRISYTQFNSKISVIDMLQGYKLTEADRATLEKAANRYNKRIAGYLKYNPGNVGASLSQILEYIRKAAERARANGLQAPAVCIDYLHLLTGEPGEDDRAIIKRAVAEFKEYAEQYNTLVLLISAQNRPANESKEPSLSAGRDSSSIEYSADLAIQLIRDKNNRDDKEISLHVVKSRFTESNMKDRLILNLKGAYSYLEPQGEWVQGDVTETPFNGTDKNGTVYETI